MGSTWVCCNHLQMSLGVLQIGSVRLVKILEGMREVGVAYCKDLLDAEFLYCA